MSRIRFHYGPTICCKPIEEWGAKEYYLFERSYQRYKLTESYKYLSSLFEKPSDIQIKQIKDNFIGSIDEIRFITCSNLSEED